MRLATPSTCVSATFDYHKLTSSASGIIARLLKQRAYCTPTHIHFTMRDAITHYMGVANTGYEEDTNPHVVAVHMDYKDEVTAYCTGWGA